MNYKKVIFGAIGYVYQYRVVLAKALLIPFLLYMTLDALKLLSLDAVAIFGLSIATIMIQTLFAITTHRIVLLGPGSVPKWGLLDWSRREMYFALYTIGLGLIMLPLGLLALVPTIGWLLAMVLAFWVVGRLSLVFPSLAIDQGMTFKMSWQRTKNYQALMFFVVMIFPVLLLVPAFLLEFLPDTFILASFLSTLATVFMVAALSVSYRIVCGQGEQCAGITDAESS